MILLNLTNAHARISPHGFSHCNAKSIHSVSFLNKQSCYICFRRFHTDSRLTFKRRQIIKLHTLCGCVANLSEYYKVAATIFDTHWYLSIPQKWKYFGMDMVNYILCISILIIEIIPRPIFFHVVLYWGHIFNWNKVTINILLYKCPPDLHESM